MDVVTAALLIFAAIWLASWPDAVQLARNEFNRGLPERMRQQAEWAEQRRLLEEQYR